MATSVTEIAPHQTTGSGANSNSHALAVGDEQFGRSAGIILFASHLVVAIPRSESLEIANIAAIDSTGLRASFSGWSSMDHADETAGSEWRLVAVRLPRGSALDFSQSLQVIIDLEDGEPLVLSSRVTRFQAGQNANPILKTMIAAAAAGGAVDPRAAAVLDDRTIWTTVDQATPVHFAPAAESDDVLLIEGWIKDLKFRSIALMNRDLTSFLPVEDMVLGAVERPKQEKKSRRGTLTRLESFIGCLELHGSRADEVFLVESAGGQTTVSGPYLLSTTNNPQRILFDLSERIENEADLQPATALVSVEAYASGSAATPSFKEVAFGPSSIPTISVVVTLSGDEIFLQSILHHQAFLPPGIEFVLGLEASTASAAMARFVASRKHRLKGPVKFVIADATCGPIRLKNACAAAARGDTLIFAREDAWFEDRRPWQAALLALRERQFDLIGVGTRFDDGSIDNEGLVIDQDDLNHRLFRPAFRGRGYPAVQQRAHLVEPVDGVSSAGLITTRGRFFTIGQFDDRYNDPLYADAEFAARARAAGAAIGFSAGSGLVRPAPSSSFTERPDLARDLVDRLRFSIQIASQPAEGAPL